MPGVTPFNRDLFLPLNFRVGLKSNDPTIIVDKLMKFAGNLVCGMLIKAG